MYRMAVVWAIVIVAAILILAFCGVMVTLSIKMKDNVAKKQATAAAESFEPNTGAVCYGPNEPDRKVCVCGKPGCAPCASGGLAAIDAFIEEMRARKICQSNYIAMTAILSKDIGPYLTDPISERVVAVSDRAVSSPGTELEMRRNLLETLKIVRQDIEDRAESGMPLGDKRLREAVTKMSIAVCA